MGTDGPRTQGGEAGKKWSDKGETTRAEAYPRENKKPHPGGGLKPGHGGGTGEGGLIRRAGESTQRIAKRE